MRGPTRSGYETPTLADEINGKSAAIAHLLDENLVPKVTVLGPMSRPAARRARLSRAKMLQAEDQATANRRLYKQLAMISHELRNSLGAIRNAIRLMEVSRDDEAISDKARRVVERQTGQMTRLVDDLLKASRIRGGGLRLWLERVDLRAVARQAIDSLEPEIGERNQRLSVALPESPVWLQADPGRLAQVLMNLLANAAKYTADGGELRLSIESDTHEATVRVRDSGIGIAPDDLPHVFEPFMQVESSLQRAETGIGMGLAVVQGLVELHGGHVDAASAGLGQGSEFTVHLPTLTA